PYRSVPTRAITLLRSSPSRSYAPFFFHCPGARRERPSFPTRRSSDLGPTDVWRALRECLDDAVSSGAEQVDPLEVELAPVATGRDFRPDRIVGFVDFAERDDDRVPGVVGAREGEVVAVALKGQSGGRRKAEALKVVGHG